MAPTIVVLGAGMAGGTAAATLRSLGFEGRVILVGDEPELPYERPPLSKEFLRGDRTLDQFLVRPAEFWDQHNVERHLGTSAVRVDPASRLVVLDNGLQLRYDKLLVATGLRNRTIAAPGSDLAGIHGLRTAADARAIRAAAEGAGHAVVVGMGFIGAEVTASLRAMGIEVDVVEPLPGPVHRALGPELGAVLAGIHREHGAVLHFVEGVEAFEGKQGAGNDRVTAVVTRSAGAIACDLVVVGVGTQPATEALAGSGIPLDNGVVVDEYCQTPVPDVYAAGDVANHYHPGLGRHIRVEHWQHALKHGAAAARSMLGERTPYADVHWFWSDQYDLNIQAAGVPAGWDDMVVRGSMQERRFVAFSMHADRIAGAVAFNSAKDLRRCMPLIQDGAAVDRARLADPDVDIRTVREEPAP